MKLICPTCKTHGTDFDDGSITGFLKCENEDCYTNRNDIFNFINIGNISLLALSQYSLYLLDDKNRKIVWRLYGSLGRQTELFEIKRISIDTTFNYPIAVSSNNMGGSIIITAGSGTATNGNGGTVTLRGGIGGIPSSDSIISVSFIPLSLDNFHLGANHILKRLQNLIAFS